MLSLILYARRDVLATGVQSSLLPLSSYLFFTSKNKSSLIIAKADAKETHCTMSLLNPGTLTEYEGPSRSSRRSRGTVRVRDPAHGFFVAGSSIDELNGIFGRVRTEHVRFLSVRRPMRLAYRHDKTGWLMVLVDVDPEEMEDSDEDKDPWMRGGQERCDTQWRFIDDKGVDRFRHKGDTIIPGAGIRWKHFPKPIPEATRRSNSSDESSSDSDNDDDLDGVNIDVDSSEGRALVEVKQEENDEELDEDELPWQLIALLDRSVMDDLRFSSACRDERVERALMGLDVEQPPESTIEGFLTTEQKALRAIESIDGKIPTPRGWLYRVVAKDGVELYNATSDKEDDGDDNDDDNDSDVMLEDVSTEQRRAVGKRSCGDFIRVAQAKGQWLRLEKTERPLCDVPLQVGDVVRVISGHYKHKTGKITEDLNPDSREFGVSLDGYTGTGYLHVSALNRNGPMPGTRAARTQKAAEARARREERRRKLEARERHKETMQEYYGQYYSFDQLSNDESSEEGEKSEESKSDDGDGDGYDDAYSGPLWVKEGSSLTRVLQINVASLLVGEEKEDPDLFDRPFEPRIEAAASEVSAVEPFGEESDGEHYCDEDADSVPVLENVGLGFDANCTGESDNGAPQVGSLVSLRSLKSGRQFNGRLGTVLTACNSDKRYGVRLYPKAGLDYVGETERKLLKRENLQVIATRKDIASMSDHLNEDERDHALRAARLLDVQVSAIGLGNKLVDPTHANILLDALFRASERDALPHCPRVGNAAAQNMRAEELQETKKAYSALKYGIEKVAKKRGLKNTEHGLMHAASPYASVQAGYLGERARSALAATADNTESEKCERGFHSLRCIISDEQARLVRVQACGGLLPARVSTSKLEEAEQHAADGSVANDCLNLRLSHIHALFEKSRLIEASALVLEGLRIYPSSAALKLWFGRCRICEGYRVEGIEALKECVALGPHNGKEARWVHQEAAQRLRSLRRTSKLDFRAKDTYERGKFGMAADIYGELMLEYDSEFSDDKWGRAEALIARASCHRRNRNLKSALLDCDAALALFPRYPRALFRRGLCLLEDQQPFDALKTFEQLLRVDRKWPKLLDYLIRAVAQLRRQGNKGQGNGESSKGFDVGGDNMSPDSKDYYAVLGVTHDATEAQLKRAYRLKSLKTHPDKVGGSAAAFQLVAEAFETLNDPSQRSMYDDGVDLSKKKRKKKDRYEDSSSESEDEDGNKKKSVREEVERKYFPENYQFWPFGDPFVTKRRHEARKRKQAEREKANKDRMKRKDGRHPGHQSWWPGYDDWDI